ncbi:2-hydroxyacid dehydrogenase [Pseudomonas sp. Choline-3u-10]|uniref:2-hydroxyacid dehydrogenase n=1 Tax=Pseudomonadaceae TaxID=135621 RepID=UPI000617D522|nr:MULTISPECIES: 2-hydroxyacid dehydrogenase [unclassified Pseudomonas]MAL34452.1 2-hydroxyacid dehydrogenase [Pseudomonas sp.]MBK3795670.1 2-hydroxyacid dehydrogenase [Stutzerimonas stutzeri]MBU0950334.1 2-hydroxyacid dehydrogenase [Gammaproteobacteria bacterium]KJJ65116.1 hydroxyacid dehydrogenase [Pseudomonas sp. 10B238]MBK3877975.1 2-hydroxyacid dehydrogenase [Stutzerimonas stutzeri]
MTCILQIGPLTERFNRGLAAEHEVLRFWEEGADALVNQNAQRIDVVVTSGRFGCTAELIERLPNLQAIISFGVGYDAIDVAAARARNIPVSNTPDVLNDCVADLAFGLIIDSARQMSRADRFVRAGEWPSGGLPLAKQVSGKRLGIVGMGRIGETVAKRSSGFDMQVRYHNRRPVEGSAYGYESNLVELAQWSDFLVLTCPGGESTRNLINRDVLEALGSKGILINVARGSVVDEPALIEALTEGRLGGAGLDVYAQEPNVPQALVDLPNVVLLPHIGSATEETRLAMEELLLANLRAFLERGELLTAV